MFQITKFNRVRFERPLLGGVFRAMLF